MARPPRVDHEGAWHHVMNRGARRAPIFKADEHCSLFLDQVGDACDRFGIEVHAHALVPNHYHLLVRSPLGTLSDAMRRMGANYTQSVNRVNRWDGPVFRGRFRNQPLDGGHAVLMVAAYIHLRSAPGSCIAWTLGAGRATVPTSGWSRVASGSTRTSYSRKPVDAAGFEIWCATSDGGGGHGLMDSTPTPVGSRAVRTRARGRCGGMPARSPPPRWNRRKTSSDESPSTPGLRARSSGGRQEDGEAIRPAGSQCGRSLGRRC